MKIFYFNNRYIYIYIYTGCAIISVQIFGAYIYFFLQRKISKFEKQPMKHLFNDYIFLLLAKKINNSL